MSEEFIDATGKNLNETKINFLMNVSKGNPLSKEICTK